MKNFDLKVMQNLLGFSLLLIFLIQFSPSVNAIDFEGIDIGLDDSCLLGFYEFSEHCLSCKTDVIAAQGQCDGYTNVLSCGGTNGMDDIKCIECLCTSFNNSNGDCETCQTELIATQGHCTSADAVEECGGTNGFRDIVCSNCESMYYLSGSGLCASCKQEHVRQAGMCSSKTAIRSCDGINGIENVKCESCVDGTYWDHQEQCQICQKETIRNTGHCLEVASVVSCTSHNGLRDIKCNACEEGYYLKDSVCITCKTPEIAEEYLCANAESVTDCSYDEEADSMNYVNCTGCVLNTFHDGSDNCLSCQNQNSSEQGHCSGGESVVRCDGHFGLLEVECDDCTNNYYLNEDDICTSCQEGWVVSSSGHCKSGDNVTGCASQTGTQNVTCNECQHNYYLTNEGKCINCQDDVIAENGFCKTKYDVYNCFSPTDVECNMCGVGLTPHSQSRKCETCQTQSIAFQGKCKNAGFVYDCNGEWDVTCSECLPDHYNDTYGKCRDCNNNADISGAGFCQTRQVKACSGGDGTSDVQCNSCVAGHHLDPDTNKCFSCQMPDVAVKGNCLDAVSVLECNMGLGTVSCNACAKGFYLNGNTCTSCSVSSVVVAGSCLMDTIVRECKHTFLGYDEEGNPDIICSNCTSGSYFNEAEQSCKVCAEDDIAAAGNCENNIAVTHCSGVEGEKDVKCSSCAPNNYFESDKCKTCQNKETADALHCKSYLDVATCSLKYMGTCSDCKDGYYLDNGNCYPCSIPPIREAGYCGNEVYKCTSATDDIMCDTCITGTYKEEKYSSTGTRCLTCNNTITADSANCKDENSILQCVGETEGVVCTVCKDGYFLNDSNVDVSFHECIACQTEANAVKGGCFTKENVLTCESYDGSHDVQCDKCHDSFFVNDENECQSCKWSCSQTEGHCNTTEDVLTCSGFEGRENVTCANCAVDYYMTEGSVCATCRTPEIAEAGGCFSYSFVKDCEDNETDIKCSKCAMGLILVGDYCIACNTDDMASHSHCEVGMVNECQDEGKATCHDCLLHYFADPNSICQDCRTQNISDEGKCKSFDRVRSCDGTDGMNDITCYECLPLHYLNSNTGVCSECRTDEIEEIGHCYDIGDITHCEGDNGQDVVLCNDCKEGWFLNDAQVCTACQRTEIAEAGLCRDANAVVTCDEADGLTNVKCNACIDMYELVNGDCLRNACPDGYYIENRECLTCSTSSIAIAGECLVTPLTCTVTLIDSYGDGWNGAQLQIDDIIFSFDTHVLSSFEKVYMTQMKTRDFSLLWLSGGSFSDEVSAKIECEGNVVYEKSYTDAQFDNGTDISLGEDLSLVQTCSGVEGKDNIVCAVDGPESCKVGQYYEDGVCWSCLSDDSVDASDCILTPTVCTITLYADESLEWGGSAFRVDGTDYSISETDTDRTKKVIADVKIRYSTFYVKWKDNYGQNAANDRAKVECGGKVRYDKSFAERRYDWIEVNGQDENDMLTCSYNNSEVRDIVCKVDETTGCDVGYYFGTDNYCHSCNPGNSLDCEIEILSYSYDGINGALLMVDGVVLGGDFTTGFVRVYRQHMPSSSFYVQWINPGSKSNYLMASVRCSDSVGTDLGTRYNTNYNSIGQYQRQVQYFPNPYIDPNTPGCLEKDPNGQFVSFMYMQPENVVDVGLNTYVSMVHDNTNDQIYIGNAKFAGAYITSEYNDIVTATSKTSQTGWLLKMANNTYEWAKLDIDDRALRITDVPLGAVVVKYGEQDIYIARVLSPEGEISTGTGVYVRGLFIAFYSIDNIPKRYIESGISVLKIKNRGPPYIIQSPIQPTVVETTAEYEVTTSAEYEATAEVTA